MQPADLTPLRNALIELAPQGRSALLPALHAAQAIYGHLTEEIAAEVGILLGVPLVDVHGVIEFYSLLYNQPVGKNILRVCTDPACALRGAEDLLQAAFQEGEAAPPGEWTVERSPCLGLCSHAPAANLSLHEPDSQAYLAQTPISYPIGELKSTDLTRLAGGRPALPIDTIGGEPRLITALCGRVRAATLAEYQADGGMQAVKRWVGGRRPPEELVEEIKASGLVGMGGAAFPTGVKWEGAANALGQPKYLVINADESEPGTFKDRILLEGDPCRVLEGAILGAYAIGAHQAYCYIRGEYPVAIQRVQAALGELRQAGYLGEDILGSGFTLEIEVRSGAGAYICGEETALFESIEGRRGFPRIKPPFPTTHGLFGRPTVINNVETLAKVPFILAHGVEIFRQLGTPKSPGTKLFCLSGDVARPGLYEMPFGVSLRELLYNLAGGVTGGGLQAVLLGGAAGAFAGPQHLDVSLSFEDLRTAGLPLGSGVVMVFNDQRDLRQVLMGLARFFAHESCGKCYPCQMGTQRQYEILSRFAAGRPQPGDLSALQDVAWTMVDSSLCGLGQTAANATLSALQLWPGLVQG